jgi:hypothetical protein
MNYYTYSLKPEANPQEQSAFSSNAVQYQMCMVVDHQSAKSANMKLDIQTIPESFMRGMADCQSGRVVDMDKAMTEPPPNAD